jgi:hypothetical protein
MLKPISRTSVPLLSALAGIFLLFRAVAPAQAGPVECEAIGNAFNAIAAVPAYRQVIDMTNPSMKLEGVVIGETVYMSIDGKWNKVTLKPGGRKGMLDEIMKTSSVFDCKELRAETLPAGRTKVYEYMMNPPKGMPGVSDKPAKHTVWLGVSDGLVHRMQAENMTIELSFDKQVPPIP